MIHQEMDINQEWVFLPDNRFLDINQDGEKKIHGGKKTIKEPDFGSVEADKVSFRKPTHNYESVDMTNKMDSPKWGFIPQIDAADRFNFDDKTEILENNYKSSPIKKDLVEKKVEKKGDVSSWEEKSGGLNLWKWSLNGIGGAICSFGVVAATFCIIILGSQQRHRQERQNQKLLLQENEASSSSYNQIQ